MLVLISIPSVGASIACPNIDTSSVRASTACPNTTETGIVHPVLTKIGEITYEMIRNIHTVYSCVSVDYYVIMPNHIHLLITIQSDETERAYMPSIGHISRPTISRIIQQFKGAVTKRVGVPIWQKLFFDRVIRNQDEYNKIAEYIQYNPQALVDDESLFYPENM